MKDSKRAISHDNEVHTQTFHIREEAQMDSNKILTAIKLETNWVRGCIFTLDILRLSCANGILYRLTPYKYPEI